MNVFDNYFSEYLIVFDNYETIRIDMSLEELQGLSQYVFFNELYLNLNKQGGGK